MRRVTDQLELLDGPVADERALATTLVDLRRVNRWLGGVALSRHALLLLRAHVRARRPDDSVDWRSTPLTFLDVGCGGGDVAAALVSWTRRHARLMDAEGVDATAASIEFARRTYRDEPRLIFTVGDGRSLAYPDASFDVTHTSLVMHHLDEDGVVTLFRELGRVARAGVIINDLERGRVYLAFARLLAAVFARDPITRHDGPLSVRRAYHADELVRLAMRAGLAEVGRVRGYIGHRYALVLERAPGGVT